MKHLSLRLLHLFLLFVLVGSSFNGAWGAEPKIQILSPKDGSRIVQEQNTVLISGKVSSEAARFPNVDIVFVVDVSGSTIQYAGVDFGDSAQLPENSASSSFPQPQITIFGGAVGIGRPPLRNLRNSILAAEVGSARRLLLQLNAQTTRVGVITFGEDARLLQPLTQDFDLVRRALDDILRAGPYGGTNMVEGIRLGIKELIGIGTSPKKPDAVKVQILLTDGFPTLPIGGSRRVTPEDTNLAINAASLAGKAGIKVHVFALGEEALSYPRAAYGIAKESGGTYTPISRPADVLAVLDNMSVVGVGYVQVTNETTGQKAAQLRVAADGFFSSALPVVPGANRIQVFARASDGSSGQDTITVHYQPGGQRSLDLEVFLEREKSLQLEVQRLGKSDQQIQKEIDRDRENSLQRSQQAPPATEGPPR